MEPTDACGAYDEVFLYVDADGDGFGDLEPVGYACEVLPGTADNNVDCHDADPAVHPDAPELCNLRDDDCNGLVDDGHAKVPYYEDVDGDGFGREDFQMSCLDPGPGWIRTGGDCNDTDPLIHPDAKEVCNSGQDDDCDGLVDEGVEDLWFRDRDRDGYGDPEDVVRSCVAPANHVDNGDDCDDRNPDVNPGAEDVCNDGIDQDCSGLDRKC